MKFLNTETILVFLISAWLLMMGGNLYATLHPIPVAIKASPQLKLGPRPVDYNYKYHVRFFAPNGQATKEYLTDNIERISNAWVFTNEHNKEVQISGSILVEER